MPPSPPAKLLQNHPLLTLFQTPKSPSQILQIHAQLITSNLISTTFTYNTLIRTFAATSNPHKSLLIYHEMRAKGVSGDTYTYPFVLKACGLVLGLTEGRVVHGEVVKTGFGVDLYVRNGLISMYCRCGEVGLGRRVFGGVGVGEVRDLVSWNTMIGGYVGCGEMGEAKKMFDEMPERDAFSWAMMIDGYGKKIGDIDRAREFFEEMPERDLVSWNSMANVYAAAGEMIAARRLFEDMPERNVISWSILIDGYARHKDPREALNLFRQMICQGMKPDKISAVGAITACAQMGTLDQGRWIHFYIKKNKITSDVVIQTALVDMYVKCGSLDDACQLFEEMPERNVISWNVMIVGLGINGCGDEALKLFYQMEKEGPTSMDDITFLGILTACTHAGLVTEGLCIFNRMIKPYGVEPKVEHYGCLIDLLGRAGRLDEAKNILDTMPMIPNSALWGSLLAACRMHRRVDLAEVSIERLVELEADDCGVYVLMSNIYAEERMWKDVLRVRKLMSDRGMKKESGRSVIEVDGCVEEFVNGDGSHFLREEIYLIVWSLSKMLMSPN